jgi:hypothetical protein
VAVSTPSGVHWAFKSFWISEPITTPLNPNSGSLLGLFCS